jgi:hypothetical protein
MAAGAETCRAVSIECAALLQRYRPAYAQIKVAICMRGVADKAMNCRRVLYGNRILAADHIQETLTGMASHTWHCRAIDIGAAGMRRIFPLLLNGHEFEIGIVVTAKACGGAGFSLKPSITGASNNQEHGKRR